MHTTVLPQGWTLNEQVSFNSNAGVLFEATPEAVLDSIPVTMFVRDGFDHDSSNGVLRGIPGQYCIPRGSTDANYISRDHVDSKHRLRGSLERRLANRIQRWVGK
jgi:hypothetical protein